MRFSIGFQFNIEITRDGKTSRLSLPSWKRLRRQVKKRDKGICQYCGSNTVRGSVDHVIPLSKGGTDTLDNLVWSCVACNSSKRDKMLDEWNYRPPSIKHRPERIIDLLDCVVIRNALENAKATGDTKVLIRHEDQIRSPCIVELATIWNVLEISYKTGVWTKRVWTKERGMTQTTWADCRKFLLPLGFWEFDEPEILKEALFEFYYPTNQE